MRLLCGEHKVGFWTVAEAELGSAYILQEGKIVAVTTMDQSKDSSPFWKQMHLPHSPFILFPMVFIKFSFGTSLVAQMVKCLPTWETGVQSLGQEYLLEKEMASHPSIVAWKIPWTEKPGRLQSMGSQRVRHDWVTSLRFLCNSDN